MPHPESGSDDAIELAEWLKDQEQRLFIKMLNRCNVPYTTRLNMKPPGTSVIVGKTEWQFYAEGYLLGVFHNG